MSRSSEREGQRAAARRTAQMLGVGLSLVFVSFLVVSKSQAAIAPARTTAGGNFAGGTVELDDDDGGSALFDARDLVPGDSRESCIDVVYTGGGTPADVEMAVDASGDLTKYLRVRISRGTGGKHGDCSSFDEDRVVFDGALDDAGRLSRLPAFRATESGSHASFRIVVTLPDDANDASGRDARAEFIWTTGV